MSGMNYKCDRFRDGINDEVDEKYMKLGCDKIEIVKEFPYLVVMLGE